MISNSVGSNPNIMNFKLLWTWQVKLRTQACPPRPNYETYTNSFKKPELRTCLAKNRPNPGPNLENRISNPSESRFIYQNRTTNPPEPSKNPKTRTCVRSNTNLRNSEQILLKCSKKHITLYYSSSFSNLF